MSFLPLYFSYLFSNSVKTNSLENQLIPAHVANGHSKAAGPKDSKVDIKAVKEESSPDYLAFGDSSPRYTIRDDRENIAQSKQVDEWLLENKWNKSMLSDNEAALAIESILDDEMS